MTPAGCRHCGHRPANRPRRLCWVCSRRPDIRALYPTRGGHTDTRGHGLANAEPPPPPEPTSAVQGTAAKIAVLAARAAAGYGLWHEGDGPTHGEG